MICMGMCQSDKFQDSKIRELCSDEIEHRGLPMSRRKGIDNAYFPSGELDYDTFTKTRPDDMDADQPITSELFSGHRP
jgi:hypothetical protein